MLTDTGISKIVAHLLSFSILIIKFMGLFRFIWRLPETHSGINEVEDWFYYDVQSRECATDPSAIFRLFLFFLSLLLLLLLIIIIIKCKNDTGLQLKLGIEV